MESDLEMNLDLSIASGCGDRTEHKQVDGTHVECQSCGIQHEVKGRQMADKVGRKCPRCGSQNCRFVGAQVKAKSSWPVLIGRSVNIPSIAAGYCYARGGPVLPLMESLFSGG